MISNIILERCDLFVYTISMFFYLISTFFLLLKAARNVNIFVLCGLHYRRQIDHESVPGVDNIRLQIVFVFYEENTICYN